MRSAPAASLKMEEPGATTAAPPTATAATDLVDAADAAVTVDAAPPYDLAVDLEQREEEAKADFGKHASVKVVEEVFLVAGRPGAVSQALWVIDKALAAYFNNRFAKRPARALSVYLFARARPYDAYCDRRWNEPCGSPYGFYLASERRLVMNIGPGIGTLTHELVHPIVETDFPEAPDWINEGIASLFERFNLYGKNEITGSKNFRHPRLPHAPGNVPVHQRFILEHWRKGPDCTSLAQFVQDPGIQGLLHMIGPTCLCYSRIGAYNTGCVASINSLYLNM